MQRDKLLLESRKARSTLEMEEAHLARSDQHIARGRTIVECQRKRVADLKSKGRDTSHAEMTLDLFARTLAAFEHHREAILAAIEKARTPSSSQSEGWGGRRQRLLPLQCTAIDAGGFGEGGRNVVFCHDGRVLWDVASMKTPVEVSDELYRRAKAEAG